MNTEQTELQRLLDHLDQPAFYEENGKVLFTNRLAARAELYAGCAMAELLPPDASPPQGGGAAQVMLTLPDGETAATAVPYQTGRLYLLCPSEHAALDPELLLTIAKNIRAPLSNLFGASGDLFSRLEALEDPAVQSQTAAMNRACYQILRLVCNLSDMRSVLLDEMRLSREKAELTDFFRDLFARAQPLLGSAGRTLRYTCRARPFCGWIDRQRLERAVFDVLSNAVKFTPKDGLITAELEYMRGTAILRIHDSGEGIPAEQLARAFSAYERELAPGDPRWGAGFGLALAQHIVCLHGGALMLGPAPEGGTTVTLSLSLRPPDPRELQLRSPLASIDYTGGYPHELVELAEVLPLSEFDSTRVN